MNTGKRRYRQLDDATKQKISQALKGRSKSYIHRENISNSMKDYWKTIPNNPNKNNDEF